MAKLHYWALLVAAAFAVACSTVQAQPSAPAQTPGIDCTSAFFNLSGCLSYVATGRSDAAPGPECCPALAGTYDSNPICLCQLLAGGAESLGVSVDNSKALKLPSLCHLDVVSVSLCTEIGIPIPRPSSFGPSTSPSSPPRTSPRFSGLTIASPPLDNFALKTSSINLLTLAGLSIMVVSTIRFV